MRTRKLAGTVLAGMLLAGVLAGCGDTTVDAQPAAGSPDVGDAAGIFADLPLDGAALVPFNEDESIQLRQQFELLGGESGAARVESGDAGCQAVLRDSFALANLHWPSLAAASGDGKASAQVFLAPSAHEVSALLAAIQKQATSCRAASVTFGGQTTRIRVEPFQDGFCPAGFIQTVTRDGKTQSLEVCFAGARNALLAVAVTDRSRPDTEKQLADYAQDFLARLGRLYSR